MRDFRSLPKTKKKHTHKKKNGRSLISRKFKGPEVPLDLLKAGTTENKY